MVCKLPLANDISWIDLCRAMLFSSNIADHRLNHEFVQRVMVYALGVSLAPIPPRPRDIYAELPI